MYSPSLQHLLAQAHIQELHRSRQTSSARPSSTTDRAATRRRNALKPSAYLAYAIERLAGHAGTEAPAF